ncbi:MAG: DMT family transporter, partial [Treponemataceae bacterium]|nr:DMT family transporter [Treponemataceae bacterium]
MMPNRRGTVFLVIAALLWSLGGVLIKSVAWNPLAISGARSGIAALVFLLYLRRPRLTFSAAQIGGALSYAGTVVLFVLANKLTTAANAIILQYSAPIYVALLSGPLLHERPKKEDFIAIGGVFTGIALFFLGKMEWGTLVGNLVAIGSGVMFALLAIFLRLERDGSPFEAVLMGNILAALIGLPFMWRGLPELRGMLFLGILGVFQIGVAYLFYVEAVKTVTAFEACFIPIIEPILNPVWVFLFLHEAPGKWALFGGGIILLAVVW